MAQTLLGAIGSDIYGGLLGAGNTIFDLARAGGAYLGQPADMNYQQALALREEQEEQSRKLLEASKPKLLEAQKIIESRKPQTPTAPVGDAPVPPLVAPVASPQSGLLGVAMPQQEQRKPSVIAPLLSDVAQNVMDAYIAQGTLEASMPQLVTAQNLDKLRTITPQMVMAQSQKIKQERQQRESKAARDAVSALKDQLAIQRDLKSLSAEDNKKLEREAESIIKARDTIGFIDEALPLISGLSTGNVLAQGTQFLAGTPAYKLEAALKPIRARIGFDELTRMRQMSPTGGALGQVSNFENQLLQATKGSLEIGTPIETMRRNLLNYRDAQMAMIHGIVDNEGRLRRLESQGDLDALRAGQFRVATESDSGLLGRSGNIMNYNRQTGAFE